MTASPAMLAGKTALVTGATSGIGLETAVALAGMGAGVVISARNAGSGGRAAAEIRRRTGREAGVMLADFSSLSQTRRLAGEVLARHPRLSLLVNNAGLNIDRHALSEDGIETTMAVNFFAPFLLTGLLIPALKAGAPARIVNVASTMHRRGSIDWTDLRGGRPAAGSRYGRSKLAMVMFTRELARRLAGTGVTANAVCPGGVATGIWRGMAAPARLALRLLLKSPSAGARLPVWVAAAPELEGVTGEYFEAPVHLRFQGFEPGRTRVAPSPAALEDAACARLWAEAGRITGLEG